MSTKNEISEEIHPKTIITATLQDKFTPFTSPTQCRKKGLRRRTMASKFAIKIYLSLSFRPNQTEKFAVRELDGSKIDLLSKIFC